MHDHTDSPAPGGRNLLLEAGENADADESACMDLLGVEEPADVDVLLVTFTKSADDRLEALKRHADAPPARVGVVSVQVGGSNGGDRVGGASGPTVRRISDPSDLTGVGIAISEFLSAWSGDGNRTVVCFESLTALLQYVDASRVFQFCNEITSKFEQAGATAHFHITPEAHERQELSVLSSLFDGRVSAADLAGDHEPEATPDSRSDLEDDPFEYADAPTDDGPEFGESSAVDSTGTEDGETAATDVSEPRTGTADGDGPDGESDDGPPADAPADLVSSVIAGEADPTDDRPSLDADIPDLTCSEESPEEPADEATAGATSHRAEREETRRRLEHIGADDSTHERPDGDVADAEAETDEDKGATGDKYAFYQRTTATVVGVVVMLVLISFLSAAMPVPLTPDDAADGADVSPTATPEEVAAANESATETATATEDASTPTPTATATATTTPTPDSSTSSSSSSGSSDDGSTSDPTATPTSTPTVTATPTATPTDTPSDDTLVNDTLDTTDDLL